MVRNVQTASTNGLRKNRITQKTRLHIVRGQLDEDAIVPDDDEERNKVLASQGVDAEDANEHHLQAALNAAAQHKHAGGAQGKHHEAHIPTPDAAGIVASYDSLYQSGKYKQPTTHLRFSETVEESIEGGLAGGFTYLLDERDAEWIKKNNQEARGEGTSASANTNGHAEDDSSVTLTRSGRTLHSRTAKTKGKEPEQRSCSAEQAQPARIVMHEDEFELVMGLFEKFTEEKFPFIHLDLEAFPSFLDYESAFAAPLPPATFAVYVIPASVPPPERMVLVARAVYPYWRERKIERDGKRVVPQLDYDETQESSYICFRRRDVKPVRRTRASSTAYTDKLIRLRGELQTGVELARMVLEREKLKREGVVAGRGVWLARCALVKSWRGDEQSGERGAAAAEFGAADQALLFDRERVAKKPKVEPSNRVVLGLNRRPTGAQALSSGAPNADSHSPLTAHLDLPGVNLSTLSPHAYVAVQSAVRERYLDVQAGVERDVAGLRARDAAWEDVVDMPVQALPVAHSDKMFKPCALLAARSAHSTPAVDGFRSSAVGTARPATAVPAATSLSQNQTFRAGDGGQPSPDGLASFSHGAAERHPRSLRLRTGRGGRLHLDRRLHMRQHSHSYSHPLLRAERAGWPQKFGLGGEEDRERAEEARWQGRDWRPVRGFVADEGRRVRVADKLGKEYWMRESVYGEPGEGVGKRKRGDEEEETVGFEHCEVGLGLSMHMEWEKGSVVGKREGRLSGRESGDEFVRAKKMKLEEPWHVEGQAADAVEHACRVEERWRYDSDVVLDEQDQFMLDDFQPKFLRTVVTLLDVADHEAIQTDVNLPLVPLLGTKLMSSSPSRVSEQERGWGMSLRPLRVPPQPQSQSQSQPQPHLPPQPPAIPKIPQQPAPNATSPLPQPPPPLPQQVASAVAVSGTESVDERVAKQPASHTPSQSPVTPVSATAAGASHVAQQRTGLAQPSPSSPGVPLTNGFHPRPLPLVNGDDGATVRVSTPMRAKAVHAPVGGGGGGGAGGLQQQQGGVGAAGVAVNGFTSAHAGGAGAFAAAHQGQPHGVMHPSHIHGLNPQQYTALRNVFGMQQQQQQQQQQQHQQHQHQQQSARPQMGMPMPMPMNGVPVNGNVNLQIGPGNLNLKLPPSRPQQLRLNGGSGVAGGDANGVNISGSPVPHHARTTTPAVNGHFMTPGHGGRASPGANGHLLGHASSPLGHPAAAAAAAAAHANQQHHHHAPSSLVSLPLHATSPPRPAPGFIHSHQQMVGATGQRS